MNNRKIDKFLPIGSIVLLKNGVKKAMVNGYCIVSDDHDRQMFDYNACVYPEGLLSTEVNCVFNHDQIETVIFIGYESDEYTQLNETLLQNYDLFLDKVSNSDFINSNISYEDLLNDTNKS